MNVSNKKCIKNLSKKSLKSAKVRNVIAILAIALTTVLFAALFTITSSINYSFQQQNFRMAGGDMHASFKNLTEQQVQELRDDPLMKESGARRILGMPSEAPFLKAHVEVSYIEPKLAKHYFCVPKEGSLPEEGTNQAAADTRVLALLGVEPKVGNEFTITYQLGQGTDKMTSVTETFVLSGWWEYDEAVVASNVLVPRSYADEVLKDYKPTDIRDMTGKWSLDAKFSNALHIRKDVDAVLQNHGYQGEEPDAENYISTGVNWGYSGAQFSQKADPTTMMGIIVLLILIIFTGYLIIYNVFQISVTNDIRFYGLLKTIGTTGKQLKKIVVRQAMSLSLLGIPVGLLMGFFIGKFLTPVVMKNLSYKVTHISTNPWIFIGAAVFSLVTVFISCLKPGKVAAKVSPIEAIRYTEGKDFNKRKIVKRSGEKGCSLFWMAWANLGRNRKKTMLVVISLSLAVVLMNLTVTFVNGFDMNKYLGKKVVSDFIVGHADYFQTGRIFRDSEQAVKEDIISEIEAQGGVKESGRIYGQTSLIEAFTPKEYYRNSQLTHTPAQILDKEIEGKEKNAQGMIAVHTNIYGMEEFPLSLTQLVDGDISKLNDPSGKYIAAVYVNDDYGVLEPESHWAEVGDKVTLRYVEEFEYYNSKGEIIPKEKIRWDMDYTIKATKYRDITYEIAATLVVPHNEGYRYYGSDQYVMSAAAFQRDSQTSDIMTYLFNMNDQTTDEKMKDFLEEYTTRIETSYDYESKQDYIGEFEGLRSMFLAMGGALSLIVGIVGVLNFVNTVLTGIITRKREFAVLQSIGMTGKQLKRMLMCEGILYTIAAITVSLLLALLTGPILQQTLNSVFWFFSYQFTILPIIIITPIFVLLGVVIPLLTYQVIAKYTIVERLRDSE